MALTRAFIQLRPIVAALGRHKVATALIVLQVALTLAVASNALFIVATRIVHLSRPTGTDEAHIFVIRNGWKMGQHAAQIDANIRSDLDTLRHVAGVRDAFSSQGFPLAGYSANIIARLKLEPDQKTRGQLATFFASDEHTIDTLGISLVEGRNFRPDEITAIGPNDKMSPPGIIVTRSLADKLFPDGQPWARRFICRMGLRPSSVSSPACRGHSRIRELWMAIPCWYRRTISIPQVSCIWCGPTPLPRNR